MAALITSKYRVITSRIDSGSRVSPRLVDPFRSQKRIETSFRVSCAGAAATSGVPQKPHIRNLAGFSSPQLEQISTTPYQGTRRPRECQHPGQSPTRSRRRGRFTHDVGMDRPSQSEKGAAFKALHDGAPFIIPNPWDAGSAKVLAGLGFQALASTSSGFAFTLGRPDGGATLDDVIAHTRALDEATPLPVSVDLENGYGPDPAHAAEAIVRAAEAGAVGGSIEDYDPSGTSTTSTTRPSASPRRARRRGASAFRSS